MTYRHYTPIATPGRARTDLRDGARYDSFGSGYDQQYAVRVGGIGGRVVGRELGLDRYRADLLCEILEQARDAGREERIAA
jgi:hypothetical protein